jgi:arsenate reductase
MITIYHNNRCSKSRQTLALIEDKGVTPIIVNYLETPPDKVTLESLLKKLGLSPRDIIRKGEEAYKELQLNDASLSDDQLLNAIVEHPKLLERPIVVSDKRAVIGRPPENVLELL